MIARSQESTSKTRPYVMGPRLYCPNCGLEIEIIHRRSSGAGAEQISINLQAVPSFEAFGRFLETANPFAFWAQAAQKAGTAGSLSCSVRLGPR